MTPRTDNDRWQDFIAELRRRPATPFDDQWVRFNEIFSDRDDSLPPPPVWVPDD